MRPGYLNGIKFLQPKRGKKIGYDMSHEQEVGYLPFHVRDYKLFEKIKDPHYNVPYRHPMTFNVLMI